MMGFFSISAVSVHLRVAGVSSCGGKRETETQKWQPVHSMRPSRGQSDLVASETKQSWFYSTLCCVFHTLHWRESQIWWKKILWVISVVSPLITSEHSFFPPPLQRENTHLSKYALLGCKSGWKDCFEEAISSVRCYKLASFPSFPSILGGSPESRHLAREVKQTLVNLHISGLMTRSWIFHARFNLGPFLKKNKKLWRNSGDKGRTGAEWNK